MTNNLTYPTPEDKIIAGAFKAGLSLQEFMDWWGTSAGMKIIRDSQNGWRTSE